MSLLPGVSEMMKESLENIVSGDFQRASQLLSDGKAAVREKIQEETSGKMKGIISKLKNSTPLNSEELDCVRLWIVGDAEGYTQMENNFNDWLKEFKRLEGVLTGYENRTLTPDELFKLQGILEDAVRVSADIANYLEKKERIQRFEQATLDQASIDKDILMSMLQGKLVSPDY